MGDKSLEDLMRRRLARWKMRTTIEKKPIDVESDIFLQRTMLAISYSKNYLVSNKCISKLSSLFLNYKTGKSAKPVSYEMENSQNE